MQKEDALGKREKVVIEGGGEEEERILLTLYWRRPNCATIH